MKGKSRLINQSTMVSKHKPGFSRKEELKSLVSQLALMTLALTLVALVAALNHIESPDFWETIRAAIGLQGILQGVRILFAVAK